MTLPNDVKPTVTPAAPTPTTPPATPKVSELDTLEADAKTWAAGKSSWVTLIVGLVAGWAIGHFLL